MVLYQICVFGADLKSNMAARVHNVKYYLRTKFQDGIDKPQKFQNVCYHPTHQQQSNFLILVL
jgi:hypothetical protein